MITLLWVNIKQLWLAIPKQSNLGTDQHCLFCFVFFVYSHVAKVQYQLSFGLLLSTVYIFIMQGLEHAFTFSRYLELLLTRLQV